MNKKQVKYQMAKRKFKRGLKAFILWSLMIALVFVGTMALCQLVEKSLLDLVLFVVAAIVIVAFFKSNER